MAKLKALIADGHWMVPAGVGNFGAHRAAFQWIKRVSGTHCRIRLCEEVCLPNGHVLKAGATRTVPANTVEDLTDDDL